MGKRVKQERKPRGKDHLSTMSFSAEVEHLPTPKAKAKNKPLSPKTEAQKRYINSINVNTITWGVGPAGVGKTYVAARIAARRLVENEISKVILTRPAVEVGESIGFLPGELEEKMAPYIASYGQGFRDQIGQGHFEYLLRTGKIEIVPLGFMQGLSWDEPCMVLFDEAENATVKEMKMFLTRIGEGATVVIDGDPDQKMIKGTCGLVDGVSRTQYIKSVGVVNFGRDDIVRSGIVREIIDAYDGANLEEGTDDTIAGKLPDWITGD